MITALCAEPINYGGQSSRRPCSLGLRLLLCVQLTGRTAPPPSAVFLRLLSCVQPCPASVSRDLCIATCGYTLELRLSTIEDQSIRRPCLPLRVITTRQNGATKSLSTMVRTLIDRVSPEGSRSCLAGGKQVLSSQWGVMSYCLGCRSNHLGNEEIGGATINGKHSLT